MLPRGSTKLLLVAALLSPGLARAQASPPLAKSPAASARTSWELTPETRRVISEGVEWLSAQQLKRSGRWASRPAQYQMSVTALSGLALAAYGVTPGRGKHGAALRRCISWILDNQKTTGPLAGLICDSANPMGNTERPMHGHGFALLLLGQVYGMSTDVALRERIHKALVAGVRLTERTMTKEGGWFYWPTMGRARVRDEGSVTITQLQALRSARNAGVAVDKTVIDRAVRYLKASQEPDGGVRYMLKRGPTSAALTAAGIVAFQDVGVYHGEAIERAYGYLRRHLKVEKPEEQKWFFYTHLYGSQAMFHRGGPAWKAYFPRLRRKLLDLRQGKHWESAFGPAYGTACALLILQLPKRYLPIHQR